MKNLNDYVQERLVINSKSKVEDDIPKGLEGIQYDHIIHDNVEFKEFCDYNHDLIDYNMYNICQLDYPFLIYIWPQHTKQRLNILDALSNYRKENSIKGDHLINAPCMVGKFDITEIYHKTNDYFEIYVSKQNSSSYTLLLFHPIS